MQCTKIEPDSGFATFAFSDQTSAILPAPYGITAADYVDKPVSLAGASGWIAKTDKILSEQSVT